MRTAAGATLRRVPELPEVETVRRGLADRLPGHRLERVTLRRSDLRWPIPVAAVRDLAGRELEAVDRRSKYLLLRFSGDGAPIALVHLGMSGRLFLDVPKRARTPWEQHEHWRMDFGDRLLRYVDARRFGILEVTPAALLPEHRLLAHLGPEPLSEEFGAEVLFRSSRKRRVAVKSFLMDAQNVVGVGNIYASEACFRAGVRPGVAIQRTTRAQCARLADAVRSVLQDAIAEGGTTLRDYIGVDANSGYFQRYLSVYGRDGEPCAQCGTAIKRIVQTGRSTYYCPTCQR